jgi:hypothetical protein
MQAIWPGQVGTGQAGRKPGGTAGDCGLVTNLAVAGTAGTGRADDAAARAAVTVAASEAAAGTAASPAAPSPVSAQMSAARRAGATTSIVPSRAIAPPASRHLAFPDGRQPFAHCLRLSGRIDADDRRIARATTLVPR